MQITDSARNVLKAMMAKTNAQGILAVWSEKPCGKRIMFRLCVFEEGDSPVVFNEIPVLIPEELRESLEPATLDLRGTSLVLFDAGQGECTPDCHPDCH